METIVQMVERIVSEIGDKYKKMMEDTHEKYMDDISGRNEMVKSLRELIEDVEKGIKIDRKLTETRQSLKKIGIALDIILIFGIVVICFLLIFSNGG